MMQLPDLQQKQILFIDSRAHEGVTGIRFENDNLVFEKDGKVVNRASCHRVLAVFILGDLTLTTALIRKGAECGVIFFFMNNNFKVYGAVGAYSDGNFLLRSQQYKVSEEVNLKIAKHLIKNKISNQARLLQKRGNNDGETENVLKQIDKAENDAELRGIEGNYASKFFKEYFAETNWVRREPRTKGDIQNLLLDIGYTTLFNFIDALLRLYGFDVYKGVYHKLFFARKSLVTDIQEPFRCIVDKALLKAYNLKQVNKKDFYVKDGAYVLPWQHSQKYYRLFSEAIMERKEEIYLFIQAFYRHMMHQENELQYFDITKKYKK